MASIDKRPDGRYRARWREYPGGPRRTLQLTRKGDAERFLDAIRGDLVHGLHVDRGSRPSSRLAVVDRIMASSPCIRVALPKRNDAEVSPLGVREVEALVGTIPDRYRALIVFAAGMGLRQGEWPHRRPRRPLPGPGYAPGRYQGRRKTRLHALAVTVANFKRLGDLGAFDTVPDLAAAACGRAWARPLPLTGPKEADSADRG